MKKRLSGVVLSLLLVICFALAGCGSKDSKDSAVIGTWKLVSASEATSGIEVTQDQLEAFGLNDYSFEFKEDGVLTATMGSESLDGTYTLKDDEATIELDGSTVIGKIADNKMTLEESGTSIVLEKQ